MRAQSNLAFILLVGLAGLSYDNVLGSYDSLFQGLYHLLRLVGGGNAVPEATVLENLKGGLMSGERPDSLVFSGEGFCVLRHHMVE